MSGAAKPGGCPICGKPVDRRYRPFCCKRCADVDLGKWLSEDYTIPAVEPPDDWPEDWPDGDDDAPKIH